MNGTPRCWHVEVKQTELQHNHYFCDRIVGEKMKITTVLLFVVVALLFNIACSTSVQDVFETEGKLYFEQQLLFVYTEWPLHIGDILEAYRWRQVALAFFFIKNQN